MSTRIACRPEPTSHVFSIARWNLEAACPFSDCSVARKRRMSGRSAQAGRSVTRSSKETLLSTASSKNAVAVFIDTLVLYAKVTFTWNSHRRNSSGSSQGTSLRESLSSRRT